MKIGFDEDMPSVPFISILYRGHAKYLNEKVKDEEQICWSKYITMMTQYLVDESLLYLQKPDSVPRPGTPIEVDYEMSLNKIGRIYTLFIGKFPIDSE